MGVRPVIKPRANARTDRGLREENISSYTQNVWEERVE
jgi:hypothetical protein